MLSIAYGLIALLAESPLAAAARLRDGNYTISYSAAGCGCSSAREERAGRAKKIKKTQRRDMINELCVCIYLNKRENYVYMDQTRMTRVKRETYLSVVIWSTS